MPIAAAFIPVTVNLAVLSLMGKVTNPALLGLGTSVGMLAGFVALFGAIYFRRGASPFERPEPEETILANPQRG